MPYLRESVLSIAQESSKQELRLMAIVSAIARLS